MAFSWLLRSLVYISVPFALLCSISASQSIPAKIRYYLRAGLYLGTMSAVAVSAAFIGLGMNLINQRYNVNWVVARLFYNVASRALGINVEVEGEEYLDERPAVILSNHQSMLDILFVGRVFPFRTSMMAKTSLQFSPLGPFMHMSGSVFVDRGNSTKALRSLEAAAATIKKEKVGLWVFPEGTRHLSEVPDLLPFKKGAFHLAVQAQIPIVPLVAENYWRLYRSGVFDEGKIKVKVLAPIPTVGLTKEDVPALVLRVREEMLAALREISIDPTEKTGRGKYSSPTPQPAPPPPATTSRSEPDLGGTVPPSTESKDAPIPTSESKESLSSSTFSSSSSPRRGSENGAETEEDEGMVLVGRPKA